MVTKDHASVGTVPDFKTNIVSKTHIESGATGSTGAAWFAVTRQGSARDVLLRVRLKSGSHDTAPARIVFPPQLREAQLRILSFAGRPQNWDGQGAQPIADRTLQQAEATLWELAVRAAQEDFELPTPFVAISPDGEIGFEWTAPDTYVALSCDGDSRMVFVRFNARESERTVTTATQLWRLVEPALRHLVQGKPGSE